MCPEVYPPVSQVPENRLKGVSVTTQEIREHVALRESIPGGTIARIEGEDHAGAKGEVHRDIQPIALAFIRASHGQPCGCVHCDCGR